MNTNTLQKLCKVQAIELCCLTRMPVVSAKMHALCPWCHRRAKFVIMSVKTFALSIPMWGPLTTLLTRLFWASVFFGLELWSRLRALSEARTWDGPLDGPPAPVIESTTRLHGCPAFYVSTARPAPRAIYSLCFLACLPACPPPCCSCCLRRPVAVAAHRAHRANHKVKKDTDAEENQ